MGARSLLLVVACALAAPSATALAGGVSETPWKDWENGWSMKPMRGWDTRPPSLPGTSDDVRVAAGWYPRAGKSADDRTYCVVLALGRYFDESLKPSEGKADPPAPVRFPKWLEGWLADLRTKRCLRLSGKGQECRVGPDPGWQYEGEYEMDTSEMVSGRWYETSDLFRIVAVGVRRGDYEVAVVYYLQGKTWEKPFDLKPALESALSLRFLDAKDMARKREELEAKSRKAGGNDEAWLVRVRSRIPEGWRYFRRGDTVYVHPDAVPGTTVETMASRLDVMRKKAYGKLFPAEIDPDLPPAVVKVTRDKRQYLSYGAPEGSLGYFSAAQRELVLFFQARDWWDRIDSTAVLFHEGFHQYVDQALGGVSGHPWFEEGFGDYFGGWRLYEGDPRPGGLVARRVRMDEIYDKDAWIPVGKLLRMEWDEFYGRGPDAADTGITYPQSWSLVTFLRSGKYSACVDRYWAALRDGVRRWTEREAAVALTETRPARGPHEMPPAEARALRRAALDAGFEGVDFGALEQAWLDWIAKR